MRRSQFPTNACSKSNTIMAKGVHIGFTIGEITIRRDNINAIVFYSCGTACGGRSIVFLPVEKRRLA